ncbi:MAG: queuosine precursor transporter [Chlamydiales bacterium]
MHQENCKIFFPNELLYFGHIFVVIAAILIALRLGKEALTAVFCLLIISANLFVIKQIEFLGFTVTCTEAMTVGCILSLNLIQEYWGKAQAKKAIYCSLFLLTFFATLGQFHLLYAPSSHDLYHDAYAQILQHSPRILFASLSVTFLTQRFDMSFYGFIKARWGTQFLLFRNLISLAVSQLLDTLLFSFVGLYGIVHSIVPIMIVSYVVKMLVAAGMAPFTLVAKRMRVADEL